jgi:hypothetical protein
MRHRIFISAVAAACSVSALPLRPATAAAPSDDVSKLEQRIKELEEYAERLEKELGRHSEQKPPATLPRIRPPMFQIPTPPPTTRPWPPNIRVVPPLIPQPNGPNSDWLDRQFNGRTVYVVPLGDA